MWNEKERKGKERKREVKEQRKREKRKKRKRKRRRRKRKGRRNRRGARPERWCRVSSEATNTKVVRTWAEKKVSRVGLGRKGKSLRRGEVGEKRAGRSLRRVGRKEGVVRSKKPMERMRKGRKGRKGKETRERKEKEGRDRTARKRKSVVKSAGNRGYKSIRHRGTDYAARKVVGRARKKCTERVKGKVGVHVRREGTGKGSKARRQRVSKNKMKVRSVSDRTREAHNGCKGKKARRR
jgi:ribosomal protein S11